MLLHSVLLLVYVSMIQNYFCAPCKSPPPSQKDSYGDFSLSYEHTKISRLSCTAIKSYAIDTAHMRIVSVCGAHIKPRSHLADCFSDCSDETQFSTWTHSELELFAEETTFSS